MAKVSRNPKPAVPNTVGEGGRAEKRLLDAGCALAVTSVNYSRLRDGNVENHRSISQVYDYLAALYIRGVGDDSKLSSPVINLS